MFVFYCFHGGVRADEVLQVRAPGPSPGPLIVTEHCGNSLSLYSVYVEVKRSVCTCVSTS